jgi:amino acid permease
VVTVLSYWTEEVPKAAWISIFWIVIILINVWAVKLFSSTVKFGWMIIVIVTLLGEYEPVLFMILLIEGSCHYWWGAAGRAYWLSALE